MNEDQQMSIRRHSDPGLAVRSTIAVLGSLALLALALRLPTRLIPFSTCGFKNLTGLDCPGCGMTRALTALLRGELAKALTFHPLSPIFLAIMTTLTAWAWYDLAHGSATLERMFERRGVVIGVGLVVLVLLTWAVRLSTTEVL